MYGGRQTPRNKAVAAVLGGDLYQRTRKEGTRQKGEVDVDVLLEGAERLLAVYSIPGANDRIAGLRKRHQQLTANIQYHEGRVNQQTEDLAKITRKDYADDDDGENGDVGASAAAAAPTIMSREDMEREEAEIRELEMKKKALEERVTGMEKDLGGLMR
jgi:predicted MPP superfamily phosphohydrolase